MKRLTLYFTTSKHQGLISKAIQLVQGTPFSHVAIGVRLNSLKENIIYEANFNGVVCQGYDYWASNNKIVYEHIFDYSDKEYKQIQKFCIKQLGKPYGFKNLIAILLGRTNVIDDGKSFICSELAYMALKNKFKKLFKNQDVVTPKDLYNELTQENGTK